MSFFEDKKILPLLFIILFLPLVYYFVYALPKHNAEVRELEKDKWLQEQALIEQEKTEKETGLADCLALAESEKQNDMDGLVYALEETGCADSSGALSSDPYCINGASDSMSEIQTTYENAESVCYDRFE